MKRIKNFFLNLKLILFEDPNLPVLFLQVSSTCQDQELLIKYLKRVGITKTHRVIVVPYGITLIKAAAEEGTSVKLYTIEPKTLDGFVARQRSDEAQLPKQPRTQYFKSLQKG